MRQSIFSVKFPHKVFELGPILPNFKKIGGGRSCTNIISFGYKFAKLSRKKASFLPILTISVESIFQSDGTILQYDSVQALTYIWWTHV